MNNTINYLRGDATLPTLRPAAIIHICNDAGGWGKGFVLAISARWKTPETQYRNWAKRTSASPADARNYPAAAIHDNLFALGNITAVRVEPDLWVVNMIAQHGYRSKDNPIPVRYDALETCLQKVYAWAKDLGLSLHLPQIGAGLAGGDWTRIEALILAAMTTAGEAKVPTTVYLR